ncbi:bifunctional serine/threonine-protein kinase/ABC transporter substrate-binding protein [Nostoc sphaeroides]|uniref:bifunctional serine/threonine-protein kinase/ABC transporter substrate-binding protein n=1 Tax=Nostoc sphaeroides TaxID=446679 RepID=UPI001C705D8A|nr:bifunctional serine/threonine-protein kinase/ABC transporter substrate-binding protein [Nostoc sphaeroides]
MVINGRYRLLKPLRSPSPGDNYEVFTVIDVDNNERSVLKTQIRRDRILDRYFNREIDLLLNLNDPAVPKGKDSFPMMIINPQRREILCLVMEYIDGENLESWIRNNGKIGTNLSFIEAKIEALNWLEQLTNILISIHKQGVIHRDIKPSNIILRANGRRGKELALIDFGIAKSDISEPGSAIEGSSYYTPTEVQKGQPSFKSDFYALGRTFVYLLTKKHPFEYRDQLQAWNRDTVFPDSGIIKLINDLMKEDPEQRPQSTTQILQRIEEIRNRELRQTPPPIVPFSLRDILAGIGLIVILSLAAFGFCSLVKLFIDQYRPTPPITSPTASSFSPTPSPPSPTSIKSNSVQELISAGDKSLYNDIRPLSDDYKQIKKDGIDAFKRKDYENAKNKFTELRKKAENNKNNKEARIALTDPEVLIFLNNAIARQQQQNPGQIDTIAVVAPISNVNSTGKSEFFAQGQQILFGVAQAQTKAIAKGINLEVVIANDRNSKDQAELVAQELNETFEGRSILAVIGHYASTVTCAALQKYDKDIVVISPSSSVSGLRKECRHEAFFRTASSVEYEAKALAKYVVSLKNNGQIRQPKIAAFYKFQEDDYSQTLDDYSQALFESFQSELESRGGVTIRDEFKINLNDSKFNLDKELEKVKDANILVLFPDGSTDTNTAYKNAIAVLKSDKVQTIQKILGSNPLIQSQAITKQVKLGEKFVLATDWHFKCGKDEFNDVANKTWGGDVNRLTALSYEAVQVLFPVFENSQTAVIRKTLPQELENMRLSPIKSDVFKNKDISFHLITGDRKEIEDRLLVTPDPKIQNDNEQFKLLEVLEGQQCRQ